MALPMFFMEDLSADHGFLTLSEETSRHIVMVLRMKKGDQLQLTDGKGNLITAGVTDDHKKKAIVKLLNSAFTPRETGRISIAVSLLKNSHRFEWFLEKATELGITAIVPLICERTEKQSFRADRMNNILVSAMLQSQQVWLPALSEPTSFIQAIRQPGYSRRFIAHCSMAEKSSLTALPSNSTDTTMMLIGPEGDFTAAEIAEAVANQFIAVTLGKTRLRTETAALVAATMLTIQ